MDSRFFSFVWRYSKREQVIILSLTILSFPLVYISLEIPKIIINEAIEGRDAFLEKREPDWSSFPWYF